MSEQKAISNGTTRRKGTASVNHSVDELLKSLLVLSRTIEVVLEVQAAEGASNQVLASSKVRVLQLLGHRGRCRTTQLADFLGVSKPAVTQLVDSLVDSNLVTRQAGKEDSREVLLSLTKRGNSAFQSIQRKRQHLARVALAAARLRSAGPLIESLNTIAVALAQASEADRQFCLQCGAHSDGACYLVGGDQECGFLHHIRKSQASKHPLETKKRGARPAKTARMPNRRSARRS